MTFEIVDALAYLNRQGLVHRNLSPTNILISPEVILNKVLAGSENFNEFGKKYSPHILKHLASHRCSCQNFMLLV